MNISTKFYPIATDAVALQIFNIIVMQEPRFSKSIAIQTGSWKLCVVLDHNVNMFARIPLQCLKACHKTVLTLLWHHVIVRGSSYNSSSG